MSDTRFETGARVVVAIDNFDPWNKFEIESQSSLQPDTIRASV